MYDDYCSLQSLTEQEKIAYFRFSLSDTAKQWYSTLEIDEDTTFDDIQDMFLDEYCLSAADEPTFRSNLYIFKQGNMTPKDYMMKVATKCRHLFRMKRGEQFNQAQFSEFKSIVLTGLNPVAKNAILLADPVDFQGYLKAASRAGSMEQDSTPQIQSQLTAALIKKELEKLTPDKTSLKLLTQELPKIMNKLDERVCAIEAVYPSNATSSDNEMSPSDGKNHDAQHVLAVVNDRLNKLESGKHSNAPNQSLSMTSQSNQNFHNKGNFANTNNASRQANEQCFACGRYGHWRSECTFSPGSNRNFRSGQMGGRPPPRPRNRQNFGQNQRRNQRYTNRGRRGNNRGQNRTLPVCQTCLQAGHTSRSCLLLQMNNGMNVHNSGMRFVPPPGFGHNAPYPSYNQVPPIADTPRSAAPPQAIPIERFAEEPDQGYVSYDNY